MGSGRTGWAVLLIVVGVAVSCSPAPEVNTDPVVVTTVPATTAAPTTVAPTTTAPATTTPPTTAAETTTTTVDQVEADILDAVDGFFDVYRYHLDTGLPPDPANPIYEQWLVDPQLSRTLENVRSYRAAGQTWSGSFEYSVSDVTVDGERATVVVCVFDNSTGLEADGVTVFSEPAAEIYNDSLVLISGPGGWKVSNWQTADATCATL